MLVANLSPRLPRDVDDVARIHVEALSPSIPGNERYLFNSPERMASTPVALAIREKYPQLRDRVPAPEPDAGSGLPPNLITTDTSKFEKAFGKQHWKPALDSALETVQNIAAYYGATGYALELNRKVELVKGE